MTKQNLDRFVCIVPPQLSELAKLKPLPDLTHLTVAENPVAQLPHYRQYLVFHLRTLEVLDSQPVTERDRHLARDRFEQGQCSQQRASSQTMGLSSQAFSPTHGSTMLHSLVYIKNVHEPYKPIKFHPSKIYSENPKLKSNTHT